MNCRDCNVEARWVNNGWEVGRYWWCDSCKKEEREWVIPLLVDPPAGSVRKKKLSPWADMYRRKPTPDDWITFVIDPVTDGINDYVAITRNDP